MFNHYSYLFSYLCLIYFTTFMNFQWLTDSIPLASYHCHLVTVILLLYYGWKQNNPACLHLAVFITINEQICKAQLIKMSDHSGDKLLFLRLWDVDDEGTTKGTSDGQKDRPSTGKIDAGAVWGVINTLQLTLSYFEVCLSVFAVRLLKDLLEPSGCVLCCIDGLQVSGWVHLYRFLVGCADQSTLDSMSPQEKKRQGYIHELIATEEKYNEDLQLVLEVHSHRSPKSHLFI